MNLADVILPLVWMLIKLLLIVVLVCILFGLIAGFFTYGRPMKRRRGGNIMDDALEAGMNLSHIFIGFMLGTFKGGLRKGTWLNDQEILAKLRRMTPSEFEEYIARMFTAMGYKTRVMGGSGDGGIDIEMMKDGRKHLVQCKKFITRKVNPHDVRDFYGAIGHEHIDGTGFFVTTNIFTLEAERFADGKNIDLIDGQRLVQLVRDSGILGRQEQPQSASVVPQPDRCPNCGSALVMRTNSSNGDRFWGCSRFPDCRFTKPL